MPKKGVPGTRMCTVTLVYVYGYASGRICQLPRGQEAFLQGTSSARGRGCHVLPVALGDDESLHASRFNSRDLTKQEKTGAMSFFTSSSKTIKRSSRRRSSRQRTRARYTYVRGQPSDTQARPGILATTFFCLWGYRYHRLLFFALEK